MGGCIGVFRVCLGWMSINGHVFVELHIHTAGWSGLCSMGSGLGAHLGRVGNLGSGDLSNHCCVPPGSSTLRDSWEALIAPADPIFLIEVHVILSRSFFILKQEEVDWVGFGGQV